MSFTLFANPLLAGLLAAAPSDSEPAGVADSESEKMVGATYDFSLLAREALQECHVPGLTEQVGG